MTDAVYAFAADEQPTFPGSPFAPRHPARRKIGYAAIALLVGLAATVGNALVTVNLPTVAGTLGIDLVQATWLSSIYVACNASANLLLVRSRVAFGIPLVTRSLLVLYAAAAILEFALPGFATAVLVRAASGFAAAGLTTLTIYHLLQLLPQPKRPLGLCVGITLPQFGTPLARMVPVDLVASYGGHGLQLIELALVLLVLAVTAALPLPPSRREPAFEPLDIATIALALPGLTMLCGALGAGRYGWWTDTRWIGGCLAGGIALLGAAVAVEHNRARPLLQTRWLASGDMVRLLIVALLVRFALSEQTYGAIGVLSLGGLNNDQLHTLFAVVASAMLLGTAAAAFTLSVPRLPYQVAAAATLIALGAWLDSGSTNLTRPGQLYLSQGLLGFGACLFLGPALLYGFIRVLQRGPAYLVSMVVVFSISQNVGGLLGSAVLGTYQIASAKEHASALAERLVVGDPQVAARIAAQGPSALIAALQREAAVLAFDDVFRAVALLAAAVAAWVLAMAAWKINAGRRTA